MANPLTTRTWPWMTAATLLVAGFMYWLYSASSAIQTGVVTADTVADRVPRVASAAFVGDPTRFSGQRILLSPVRVGESLGRAALTVELAGTSGYPMILDRTVVESELSVVAGDNLVVAGWVYALNDSILNVWSQRGLFATANRSKLEGQATFFLVDSLDFVSPGGQGGGSESAEGA